ncbi:hypothetical protein Y032_0062g3346 [Ancylostoma ceylanicum]|uniref:Uncharacterized protein n=1 Tax=Ancylostoma ceylanicum TaxID=53326 RepID=A0A016U1D8_9BILA|nr:hypothetical protein Y032_0062g3346 [Ancylostoma ceylanicum]
MIPCGRSDVHWLGSLYCISCFLNSNLDRLLPQLAFFTFLWCDTLLTSRGSHLTSRWSSCWYLAISPISQRKASIP